MNEKVIKKLIQKAKEASKNSYSHYSGYSVGASLLTKEGKIFTGTNIENASYGSTICAERVAIFSAISEGYKDFEALAVYSKTGGMTCANCLQVISEFSKDLNIIVASDLDYKIYKFSELLPYQFKLKK